VSTCICDGLKRISLGGVLACSIVSSANDLPILYIFTRFLNAILTRYPVESECKMEDYRMDLIYLVLVVLFFGGCFGLINLLERVK
jgi:hypothetical protein